jgi:excinuclease ABC subunit A
LHRIRVAPEGGSGGGQIVATGTPEEIAAKPRSHTCHWLAPVLHLPASKPEPELQVTAQPELMPTRRELPSETL